MGVIELASKALITSTFGEGIGSIAQEITQCMLTLSHAGSSTAQGEGDTFGSEMTLDQICVLLAALWLWEPHYDTNQVAT